MAARIYVDTNVYLDYFEERKDRIRPLDEFAYSVFRRAIECEFEIVISDWVIRELLGQNVPNARIDSLLDGLEQKRKVMRMKVAADDVETAKKTGNFCDALHALTAKRADCKVLVTRNFSDFVKFESLVEPKLPEEL